MCGLPSPEDERQAHRDNPAGDEPQHARRINGRLHVLARAMRGANGTHARRDPGIAGISRLHIERKTNRACQNQSYGE